MVFNSMARVVVNKNVTIVTTSCNDALKLLVVQVGRWNQLEINKVNLVRVPLRIVNKLADPV